MPDEDEFLQTLRATFKVEADEHIQTIASGLLELERASDNEAERRAVIEVTFRAAHSLKGAARAVNLTDVEMICQSMEDVFAKWKRGNEPAPEVIDSLHRSLDAVIAGITTSAGTPAQAAPPAVTVPTPPPEQMPKPTAPLTAAPTAPPPRPKASAPPHTEPATPPTFPLHVANVETVRIPMAKLDARLLEAEEMLTAKLTAGQRATDIAGLAAQLAEWHKEWGHVQPDVRTLRQSYERSGSATRAVPSGLPRLVEFFDWSHDFLRALEDRITALERTAQQDHLVIGKLVDDLLEDSKKLLMLPLTTLGTLFPKLVRDLCRDQGKEADLVIRGEEVEIDKRVLEEMKDPLVHLLRNCVDHGIETPDERRRLGKPPRATITLAVSPVNGNKVELLVCDDGAGIDPEKVKSSAIKHGRLTEEEARQLTESQALDFIFESDVSTSPIITQLSGRGLGLAIVREKAEKLGGQVSVESQLGAGTTMRISLPIALATFRGILVQVAERLFVIPTTQVARVGRFKAEDVRTVEGHETLPLDDRAIALVWLAEVLELREVEHPALNGSGTPFLLLGTGDQRIAFAIDAVVGEQEVLVKRLGKPLARVRNIAGATVLGSGQVAPILNVADLLKSARKAARPTLRTATEKPAEAAVKSILVAEDSITSRMLLKGILESAGYRVKTAVDGMEAFTTLRAESFDLLVSDVEMPRLNGFDLTARVRADRKLAELPVVLVTALETREDRERGIDVGANAYLVKSNFDQSNLLEAVRRLI
jgi:two-component system chemotaxis sensor kinase CheA